MKNPKITSLEALLEYAHKLPWGRENETALLCLNETRHEISQVTDVAPESDGSGVGQK